MDGRNEQPSPTPEERVTRAQKQKREAADERPAVDSLVAKLKRHLEENHFAERLYQQMSASRRHA